MKNTSVLSLALAAALVTVGSAQAQVISVQYTSDASQSISTLGQTAGFVPSSVWNTDHGNQNYFSPTTTGLSNLVDSTGTVTGISESKTGEAYYGPNGTTTGFASAGDNNLFNHGIFVDYGNSGSPAVSLTGLNATLSYNLYLYVEGTQSYTSPLLTSYEDVDAQTLFLKVNGAGTSTAYAGASSSSSPALAGNYIEFTGLTGVTSLTADIFSGNNGFTLNGFQLETVAVPEPSSWAMLIGGVLALGFVSRRRSLKA